ncbi:hypothetical protein S40285_01468 [Stachybotrys chlorohalonatus IBT 40285]|uniref:Anaphase-promoting complex subunit 4 WD40 domain-containing protein n=1 Tax=Stachybotrys chlorohalonatus (strain IBT 40285) TaxID=1283841 RepID=A0A084QMM8_STAC4|nr:hypothetical protein S40285_01468 [Stachybotrys chlorohalonata IBT 40285]
MHPLGETEAVDTANGPETLPESNRPSQAVRLLAQRPAARRPHPSRDGRRAAPSTGGSGVYFSSAQWSADGTTILAHSSDNTVSAFILPADLLKPEQPESRSLDPQSTVGLPEPTQALAAAPFFSLADPSTQTFLVGCRDHPIHLYHAFPQDGHTTPLCGYKLIRKETEQYITPSSLLWQHPGHHFVCGSANRLDLFDVSQYGSDGPILTVPTIPSRRHISKGSGVGLKGTVAALSASPRDADGGAIIAAGTWTRWVGLYDLHRTDKVVAQWGIAGVDESHFHTNLGGQGIVQLLWSPCGRYLVVNERHSAGLLVYDIRGTGQALTVLNSRSTTNQQRLSCDVFQSGTENPGFEVWAGTEDGRVLVWDEVGFHVGLDEPAWHWGAHDSPIGSTFVHPSGSVVATCSGGWRHASDIDTGNVGVSASVGIETLEESSLKIWSIGPDS